jgi:flavin-dependent dehydrogenase
MTDCDIFIAGGGPAGSATALALARSGFSVCLAEYSRYEAPRPGESLAARTLQPLRKLDAADCLLRHGARTARALHSAWGGPGILRKTLRQSTHPFAWQVDRRRFDESLAERAARAGAQVLLDARCTEVERSSDAWRVRLQQDGRPAAVSANFLVDATGRAAVLARRLGARQVRWDRLVAVQGLLPPALAISYGGPNLLLESSPSGWWYSVPLPDGPLLSTYLTDSDLLPGSGPEAAWTNALGQAPHTARRAGDYHPLAHLKVTDAGTTCLLPAAGPGWLAVGDTAIALDPLSGDGVCRALQSGVEGADTIRRCWKGDTRQLQRYDFERRVAFRRGLAERGRFYGLERRWRGERFWRRRRPIDFRAVPPLSDSTSVPALAASPDLAAAVESLLPPAEADRLVRLLDRPRPAAEILREFSSGASIPLHPDEVRLALRVLFER